MADLFEQMLLGTYGKPEASKVGATPDMPTTVDSSGNLRIGITTSGPQPSAAPVSDPSADFEKMLLGTYGPPIEKIESAQTYTDPLTGEQTRRVGKIGRFLAPSVAALDVTLGGVIPGIVAPVTYMGSRALGASPEEAKKAEETALKYTAQPFGKAYSGVASALTGIPQDITQAPEYKGEALNQAMDFVAQNMGKGADWISQKTGIPKTDVENMMQTVGLGVGVKTAKPIQNVAVKTAGVVEGGLEAAVSAAKAGAQKVGEVAKPFTPMEVQMLSDKFRRQPTAAQIPPAGSAGAAATPVETAIRAAIDQLPPDEAAAVAAKPINDIDLDMLNRRVEAASIGVRLSEGQASQNPKLISDELNTRGQPGAEQTVQMLQEQNQQLAKAIDTVREQVAPEAFGTSKAQHGDTIIEAYKNLDNQLNADIEAKYTALRDAAGGKFPVDVKTLKQNVDQVLSKELLTTVAEKDVSQFRELAKLAESGSMNFEQYLAMRRNLGAIARTSSDGNVRKAASLMIDELEKLPLSKEAAGLKPLADQARSAARARFEMLERDPAMKAAVDDKVSNAAFTDKFVLKGINKNIEQMIQNLGEGSQAHHSMRVAAIDHLRKSAGLGDQGGNFTQAGFNKALRNMHDMGNLNVIFGPEGANRLRTIGNVANYTQFQPKGAYVNTSNTATALQAIKGWLGSGTKNVVNVVGLKTMGVPLGNVGAAKLQQMQTAAQTQKTWAPGAGITKELRGVQLKDIGK